MHTLLRHDTARASRPTPATLSLPTCSTPVPSTDKTSQPGTSHPQRQAQALAASGSSTTENAIRAAQKSTTAAAPAREDGSTANSAVELDANIQAGSRGKSKEVRELSEGSVAGSI